MPESPIDLDTRFRLLRALENDPNISQRNLAQELGLSLGKVNYCLRALIDKGWVKAGNFHRSEKKHRYLYKLTPAGLSEKARITNRFLKRKIAEHRALTEEIERLRGEVGAVKE
ncbi:MarR family EPS-associated transcriptional regulator [Wenzhouxiangella sp. EGI_FJ10305]|uniref:MarR family EPS-associated transcriptional regulator n=1 Tax=Wenzhouxiangella sp. EGI_FJ10305 TaxID=3243768 RepID=UPI0035D7A3D1